MSNRPFVLLVVAVLVLGGSLGGAFAGGVAVGRGQDVVASTNTLEQQPIDPDQLTQEQLRQLREQFQGRFGGGEGGGGGFRGDDGFGGRGRLGGGLTGTIDSIDGVIITLDTAQGPLSAILSADTTVQMFVEGASSDLELGMRVSVTGRRADDGTVEAATVLITPEGIGTFSPGSFFGQE